MNIHIARSGNKTRNATKVKRAPVSAVSHRDLIHPTPAREAFNRAGWIFELKYDGFRALAIRYGAQVRLVSRKGTDMLPCFPEIAAELREMPDLAIDGELVVLDDVGRPQFDRLAWRFRTKRRDAVAAAALSEPAVMFAFDLLELEGKDMRRLPLLKRKAALRKVLEHSERVRYLQYVGEEGERLYSRVQTLGLEGVVAKKADSLYQRGRSPDWLKIKTEAGRLTDAERRKWNEA